MQAMTFRRRTSIVWASVVARYVDDNLSELENRYPEPFLVDTGHQPWPWSTCSAVLFHDNRIDILSNLPSTF